MREAATYRLVTETTLDSKPPKSSKKKTPNELQKDLKEMMAERQRAGGPTGPNLRTIYTRIGVAALVAWVLAFLAQGWLRSWWPLAVAGVLTAAVAGVLIYFRRILTNQQKIGAILQGADTAEGRKQALERLSSDFKKGDVQAVIAKAQLEMQDNPKQALATLETVELSKQLPGVSDQVRTMRGMIHLTIGEAKEARVLVDQVEMGKQQDAKSRALFASVAGEAWGRTGQAKKGLDLLDVFNPDDPELGEFQIQLLRARAFAQAGAGDMKAAGRTLRKLAEINPHLLAMFLMGKRVHPLLQREAQQIVQKTGAMPRKVVYKRS